MKQKTKLPQGWMSKRDRTWLRAAATAVPRGGIVVEVGSWRGRSTLVLAKRLAPPTRLYAVDTWAGTPDDPFQHERLYAGAVNVYEDFCHNLRPFIRCRSVIPMRMTSLEGAAKLAANKVAADLIFIDADHRYDAVRADILAYRPLVRPGGVLAGHDYERTVWSGVVQAVDELIPEFKVYPESTVWWTVIPA